MLSAHFDSWDGGTGATDNGTGTLVMMEAMRILKKVYPNPKRTILVGHWGSEEQGLKWFACICRRPSRNCCKPAGIIQSG
jgi:Zn-dependent M28 family amino/carboxypeptidase